MSQKIKAVVFDMDGVLIDAKDWHYQALNKALSLFGHQISREDHLTSFDGLPTKVKLEKLSETGYLPRGLHGFINDLKQELTYEMVHTLCRPTFIHEYALSRLKREGFRLGVASNSIRYTVDLMMKRADLAKYLDVVVSNNDVERAKPDPEIYLKSCSMLGLRPDEVLVVEDNHNGIAAARGAGTHLLEVGNVTDVNYFAIKQRLLELEGERA